MVMRESGSFSKDSEIAFADLAIIKLLQKIGFLEGRKLEHLAPPQQTGPIAHYAGLGLFAEWDAIKKIALHLSVPCRAIEPKEDRKVFSLIEQPPFSQIDLRTWRALRALPLEVVDGNVAVLMANPLDMDAIRTMEFKLQSKVTAAMGSELEIYRVLSGSDNSQGSLDFEALFQNAKPAEIKTLSDSTPALESNIEGDDVSEPAVIRMVNKIFGGAILQNASDIHISPESNRLIVRIRVDGIMRDFVEIPASFRDAVTSRIKLLCGMDIAEKRKPQDGRLRLRTGVGNRDLRLSTVPTIYGEDIVARILSSELGTVSFESLGMSAKLQQQLKQILAGSSKVVVVSGPTGSGKTSTLYAAVRHLQNGTTRIITVEDPIEYRLRGISQVQVNPKIEMTFAKALRSILRQDPDVILVGEIRDPETAAIAMQVAQTGHLVLSTIHTHTAAAVVTRLRDLGVPSFLIASSLGSVIAQRLVRKLCKACCQEAGPQIRDRMRSLGLPHAMAMVAQGCPECGGSGYLGRTAIYSVLEMSPDLRAAIRIDAPEEELERISRKDGFQALVESGLELVREQVTSLDELERVLGPLEKEVSAINTPLGVGINPVTKPNGQNSGGASFISKRKILVVDDDAEVRKTMQFLLEFQMFDVVTASDGQSALKAIYEQGPELVLCDIMMPQVSGFEVIQKIKGDPRTRTIPVIMLTAVDTEENELQLLKLGADDFISKTTRPEILVARINRLINRQ